MIALAEPSMALATGLEALWSWLAIWLADRPVRIRGLYWAPARIGGAQRQFRASVAGGAEGECGGVRVDVGG